MLYSPNFVSYLYKESLGKQINSGKNPCNEIEAMILDESLMD